MSIVPKATYERSTMQKSRNKSRNRNKAAAGVLAELATPIQSQEAKTEIVVPAEEPKTAELMVVVSSEVDIPDDAPMTEAEKADYHRYMSSIKGMCIETARMILEIRRRKLYRGEFKTFDEWVACYFGSTRQWVTGLGHWVRRQELAEKLSKDGPLALTYDGKPAYQIIPKEAEHLGPLEDHPDELCRALVEATEMCRANPKRKRTKTLEETVRKQEEFLRRKERTPDLTYEEFKAINSVGWHGRISDELVVEVNAIKAQGGDWSGKLAEEVQDGDLSSAILLGCARGSELIDLCAKLKAKKDVRDELKEAEAGARIAVATLERKKAEIAKRQQAAAQEQQTEPEDDEDDDDEDVQKDEPLAEFALEVRGSFEGFPDQFGDAFRAFLDDWKDNLFNWNLTMDSTIIVKPILEPSKDWAAGKLTAAKDLLEAALAMVQEVHEANVVKDVQPILEIFAKATELLAEADKPEAVLSSND